MDRLITSLQPVPPFDLELTAGYHAYFRGRYGADSWVDGHYHRLLDLGSKLGLASVRAVGTRNRWAVWCRSRLSARQPEASGKRFPRRSP